MTEEDYQKAAEEAGKELASLNDYARQANFFFSSNLTDTIVKLDPIVAIDWSRPVPLGRQ
jgi:hypothetical protein